MESTTQLPSHGRMKNSTVAPARHSSLVLLGFSSHALTIIGNVVCPHYKSVAFWRHLHESATNILWRTPEIMNKYLQICCSKSHIGHCCHCMSRLVMAPSLQWRIFVKITEVYYLRPFWFVSTSSGCKQCAMYFQIHHQHDLWFPLYLLIIDSDKFFFFKRCTMVIGSDMEFFLIWLKCYVL